MCLKLLLLLSLVSQFSVLFVNLSVMSNLLHLCSHSNLIHAVYNGGNVILHDLGVMRF